MIRQILFVVLCFVSVSGILFSNISPLLSAYANEQIMLADQQNTTAEELADDIDDDTFAEAVGLTGFPVYIQNKGCGSLIPVSVCAIPAAERTPCTPPPRG